MSELRNRLSYLFRRYYDGKATNLETEELMRLVRRAKEDDLLASLMKEAWDEQHESSPVFSPEASDRMLASILLPAGENKGENEDETVGSNLTDREAPSLQRWYAVAAAIALICISGVWWAWNGDKAGNKDVAARIDPDIRPGTNRAVLTLGDGSVIHLDDAADGVISQQGATEISKVGDGRLLYNEAGNTGRSNQVNIVSTPRGGQYQVGLPDGSRVWLNASSSIRFPASFAVDERLVEIEGEVFFEIERDITRPFRVLFGGNEVEVLGTSFNITHYPDEEISRTTLVEGAVALKNGSETRKLRPGQGAEITAEGAISIESVDVEEIIAWKDGVFYFQDAGIESVMRQVSRWYDIEVGYEGVVSKRRFKGKVSRNVGLPDFMAMLEYTGVRYRIEGRTMIIMH